MSGGHRFLLTQRFKLGGPSRCLEHVRKVTRKLFRDISKKFDIDGSKLLEEAKKYNQNNSAQNLEAVLESSQPKRIEILSKLNSSNKGTIRLVKLREKLFSFLKKYPDLKRVDNDFLKLFKNWFNSGFLILKKIDWSTAESLAFGSLLEEGYPVRLVGQDS